MLLVVAYGFPYTLFYGKPVNFTSVRRTFPQIAKKNIHLNLSITKSTKKNSLASTFKLPSEEKKKNLGLGVVFLCTLI